MGTFLYYSRAVECTMIPALNTISEKKSNPTNNTKSAITQFLEYAATNLPAIFQYKSRNMILHTDSDESYLSEPRVCRRTGGNYYLSLLPVDTEKVPNLPSPANETIHTNRYGQMYKYMTSSKVVRTPHHMRRSLHISMVIKIKPNTGHISGTKIKIERRKDIGYYVRNILDGLKTDKNDPY